MEDSLHSLFFIPSPDKLHCLSILITQDPVYCHSLAFSPPPPCPAKSMMSPSVAMAECGASRNMPERGRRGTEDELLQCLEGHTKATHTVRTHAGQEARIKDQSCNDSLNMCENPRVVAVRCDYLIFVRDIL